MDTLGKQAHEAAIDHGLWLAPDDDETNYQAFVAGYLRGYSDRGVEATSARDEYDAEIASLRAEVNDWRESARKASGERCEDEIHCCCVPYLRVEIASLRAKLAAVPDGALSLATASLRSHGLQTLSDAAGEIDGWLATVTK